MQDEELSPQNIQQALDQADTFFNFEELARTHSFLLKRIEAPEKFCLPQLRKEQSYEICMEDQKRKSMFIKKESLQYNEKIA